MGTAKGVCDQLKSRRKIQAAYEACKIQIDYAKHMFPWDNWKFDVSRCSPTTYGTAVRNLRMERKLTQSTFARQIGTSTATLSKIENGKFQKINPDLMYNICGIYEVTPSYLIGETSIPVAYTETDPATLEKIAKFLDRSFLPSVVGNLCEELQLPFPTAASEEMYKQYQERPEICELMLWVLQSDDPQLKEAVTSLLRLFVQFFEDRSDQSG